MTGHCKYAKYCSRYRPEDTTCNRQELLVCSIAWQFYIYNKSRDIDESKAHVEIRGAEV